MIGKANMETQAAIPQCLQTAQTITLPAGTSVFRPGDPCDKFLFVQSGSVRVDLGSLSGKTVLLYRIGPNQSCVMTTSCLMAGRDYAAEATTETQTTARMLSTAQFQQELSNSPEFRTFVFDSMTQRLGEMMAKVEQVAFAPIDQRLARRLLELPEDDGVIAITHEQLAADLGSSREVISRKLARWAELALIEKGHRSIVVLAPGEIARLADLGD